MRRLFVLALLSFAACKPTPAKIELAGKLPPLVISQDPLALPTFRVLDASGTEITPPPALRFEARPPSIATVQAGLLTPLANGDVTLVAIAPNGVEGTFPIRVRIVDRAEVSCAREGCSYGVGDEIVLGAKLFSQGEQLDVEAQAWTATPDGVVRALGGGRWSALAPGEVTVKVRAGAAEASKTVFVSSPVDQLTVTCPALFTQTTPGGASRCAIRQGKSLNLEVHALGMGKPVHEPKLEWSTKDESVASVRGGVVDAVGVGETEISAAAGGVRAAITIEILPGCVGPWSPMFIKTGPGYYDVLSLSCQGFQPKMCLDRALKESENNVDSDILESCCCKRDDSRRRGR